MDWHNHGEAFKLFETGDYEQALAKFSLLAELEPDLVDKATLLQRQCLCLLRLGRFDDARLRVIAAKRLAGKNEWLLADLEFAEACLLQSEGREEESLAMMERLLKSRREVFEHSECRYLHEALQEKRAFVLTHLGRYSEAIPLLEEALSFSMNADERSDLYHYLGICHYESGDHAAAVEALLTALRLSPNRNEVAKTHLWLGRGYFHLREFRKAKESFIACERQLQVGKSGPAKADLYKWLAATCSQLGETQGAALYTSMARPV